MATTQNTNPAADINYEREAAERYGNLARVAMEFYISTGNPAELLYAYLNARWAARLAIAEIKNSRRVVFEPETDTIRQQPENYCLLARRDGQWTLYLDKASTIGPHSLSIVMDGGWRHEEDGQKVADMVEDAFWGSHNG